MRKYILVFVFSICISLLVTIPANAESNGFKDEIVVDIENEKIEDYLDKVYDGKLSDGDSAITRSSIEDGIKYAEQQSSSRKNRMSEELWTLTGTKTLKSVGPLATKWVSNISAGQTLGQSFTASFNIGNKIEGYTVSIGLSISKTESFSGPNGTEKVGNYNATHRAITSIARGSITQYTVRITDKYSGAFIRNHTYNAVTNQHVDLYGNLITIESYGRTHVRSASSSSHLSFKDFNSWKNFFDNKNVPQYIAW